MIVIFHGVLSCNIRRPNGQEGFVPKNYVKEIEPAVIKNVTKRKVMKPEKVKLRKKRTEKQRMPKTVRRSALCMCLLVYVCILHVLVLWGYWGEP